MQRRIRYEGVKVRLLWIDDLVVIDGCGDTECAHAFRHGMRERRRNQKIPNTVISQFIDLTGDLIGIVFKEERRVPMTEQ